MESEWFVYVIRSTRDGSYYVGHKHDLHLRLIHHNDGWTRSTKGSGPWTLVSGEPWLTRKRGEPLLDNPEMTQYLSYEDIRNLCMGKWEGVARALRIPMLIDILARSSSHDDGWASVFGRFLSEWG